MEKFEYKVLWNKVHGLMHEDWFDGDENLGREINEDLLNQYGTEGWEVCASMQYVGSTHKILLKRRLAS